MQIAECSLHYAVGPYSAIHTGRSLVATRL